MSNSPLIIKLLSVLFNISTLANSVINMSDCLSYLYLDYTITLYPIESRRRQNGVLTMVVGPEVSSVIFSNLLEYVAYNVTVFGSTNGGEGITSKPIIILTIPTANVTEEGKINGRKVNMAIM